MAQNGAHAGPPEPLASFHPPSSSSVRAQLSLMLGSQTFANAPSLTRLLNYIVEQTLAEHVDRLKEYSLGVDVFHRGTDFDPRTETIVRVQARRLRDKLEQVLCDRGVDGSDCYRSPQGPLSSSVSPSPQSARAFSWRRTRVAQACRSASRGVPTKTPDVSIAGATNLPDWAGTRPRRPSGVTASRRCAAGHTDGRGWNRQDSPRCTGGCGSPRWIPWRRVVCQPGGDQ